MPTNLVCFHIIAYFQPCQVAFLRIDARLKNSNFKKRERGNIMQNNANADRYLLCYFRAFVECYKKSGMSEKYSTLGAARRLLLLNETKALGAELLMMIIGEFAKENILTEFSIAKRGFATKSMPPSAACRYTPIVIIMTRKALECSIGIGDNVCYSKEIVFRELRGQSESLNVLAREIAQEFANKQIDIY